MEPTLALARRYLEAQHGLEGHRRFSLRPIETACGAAAHEQVSAGDPLSSGSSSLMPTNEPTRAGLRGRVDMRLSELTCRVVGMVGRGGVQKIPESASHQERPGPARQTCHVGIGNACARVRMWLQAIFWGPACSAV